MKATETADGLQHQPPAFGPRKESPVDLVEVDARQDQQKGTHSRPALPICAKIDVTSAGGCPRRISRMHHLIADGA